MNWKFKQRNKVGWVEKGGNQGTVGGRILKWSKEIMLNSQKKLTEVLKNNSVREYRSQGKATCEWW